MLVPQGREEIIGPISDYFKTWSSCCSNQLLQCEALLLVFVFHDSKTLKY